MNNSDDKSVVDYTLSAIIDTTVYPTGYAEVLLTTLDNPYSPFTDYERWLNYDERQGYNTNQLLARLIGVASEFGETPLGEEIENKFYYSTLVDVVRYANVIPYVLANPEDYTEDGEYKLYVPEMNPQLIGKPA